ncbi:hypothetical protein EZS27_029797, partial [termite gut metagenome]
MIRKSLITMYFLSVVSLSLYAAANKATDEKKPIGIDFFTEVKGISNLKEKDGNIFFILSKPDKEN